MKINFTKKDYKFLIDFVYLGDWVMTATESDADERYPGHHALLNYVFSYAEQMGASEQIAYYKGSNDFAETQAYGQQMYDEYVVRYNENIFWEELINRLVERDLRKEFGSTLSMTDENQAKRFDELAEKYAHEFDSNGVGNIMLTTS